MEKEQNENTKINNLENEENNTDSKKSESLDQQNNNQSKEEGKEKSTEEKILELEDKVARTFAEMENQRRRFEKEKEDAFEYGGFSFAKEALNLIEILKDQNKF